MRIVFKGIGIIILLLFVILSLHFFQWSSLLEKLNILIQTPYTLLLLTIMYGLAFILRSYAWRLYLEDRITIQEGLYGLLYSLLVNHISPVKVGDAVRVAVITKTSKVAFVEVAQSVVVLRILDLAVLVCIAGIGLFLQFGEVIFNFSFIVLGAMAGIGIIFLLKKVVPQFFTAQLSQLQRALQGWRGRVIILLIAGSWILEAFVLYGISRTLPFIQAVWVNSITIAGQVFQLTPGGIGTYETVMTVALTTIGVPTTDAYEWALLSHGYKFLFSYGAGMIVLLVYPIQLASFLRQKQKGETMRWRK